MSCIKWSKVEVEDYCQKYSRNCNTHIWGQWFIVIMSLNQATNICYNSFAIPTFYIIIFAIEVHNLQVHK
jgi:hypothetical protein